MKILSQITILVRARALLAKRKGWIQGRSANDKNGNPTDCQSEMAVSFCMLGAPWRIQGGIGTGTERWRTALQKAAGVADLAGFNDQVGRTKQRVLAVYDTAIASLK